MRIVSLSFSLLLLLACNKPKGVSIPQPAYGAGTGEQDDDVLRGDADHDDEDKPDDKPDQGQDSDPVPPMDGGIQDIVMFAGTHQAAAALASSYNKTTGLWPDGWWPSANALTAMIDYMDLSGSREYVHLITNTFDKNSSKAFINEFYDDSAWWGLAWLRAYDLTQDARYLNAAKGIADHMMSKGWDDKCGGGIYWKEDKLQKNAVENELYIKLAAGLHNRIPGDSTYLAMAFKTWKWFEASGLINDQKLINDGLDMQTCKNNNDATWSYNQGIILSALAELYLATKDTSYLSKGKSLALASMKSLALDNQVFKERNDPGCGVCKGDERLFKGAYVRGLRELNAQLKDGTIESYLDLNSKISWEKARGDGDFIGFRWEGPFDSKDSSRQTSAVDLYNSRIKTKFGTNLSKQRGGGASGQCANDQMFFGLMDGSAVTKWCAPRNLTFGFYASIDLGSEKAIKSIRVLHAGAGGEPLEWNTRDFEILSSNNNTDWTELVKVSGNLSSANYYPLKTRARYIKLNITNPGSDNTARIYELSIEEAQ